MPVYSVSTLPCEGLRHAPADIYSYIYNMNDRPLFDWDEDNIDHIAEHDVDPEAAEEVLRSPERVYVPAHSTGSEERRAVLGPTDDGRLLFVVIARRKGRIRVVSARDATPGEKKHYRRRSK